MRVINTGTDTVPSGETINVRYQMNSGSWVNGSFVLSSQLFPDAGVTHTFSGTVNLNNPNDYIFTLIAKTATDIRVANDTLIDTIYRYSKPSVDFGLGTSYTERTTEFTIDAGYQPYYNYLWQDNSLEHEYTATNSGTYGVKVTDNRTACYGGDTVILFLIIDDLGVTSTTLGNQVCSGPVEHVQVTIRNQGTTSIGVGENIYLGYDVNGLQMHVDTIVLDRVFAFSTTRTVTLKYPIIISAGSSPDVNFYTLLDADMRPENDTLIRQPSVLSSPVVSFGDANGVLLTTLPHLLDAGSGHKAYLWNNGSTSQTFNVTANGTFSVTVTGQNDCQTSKVVYINPENALREYGSTGLTVNVYPNPSYGQFYLEISMEETQDLVMSIVGMNGQMVFNRKIEAQHTLLQPVDLTGYPHGMYQILLSGNTLTYRAKIIIY